MKQMNPTLRIGYNRLKKDAEKPVTLLQLAKARWNGQMPPLIETAMKLGPDYSELWHSPLRRHISKINECIQPREIIILVDTATYMLTTDPERKLKEWTNRTRRRGKPIEKDNRLIKDIELERLPIEDGVRSKEVKEESSKRSLAQGKLELYIEEVIEPVYPKKKKKETKGQGKKITLKLGKNGTFPNEKRSTS